MAFLPDVLSFFVGVILGPFLNLRVSDELKSSNRNLGYSQCYVFVSNIAL